MQCNNLSWFGYPEDPTPSVRATLLPGITQVLLSLSMCALLHIQPTLATLDLPLAP